MATTLTAGSATRTIRIPGATLTYAAHLYPNAVYRTPYLPGAILTNTSDTATLSAALYDRADLETAVNALAHSSGRTFTDILCEQGAASLQLQNDDSALGDFQDNGRDIIAISYRGLIQFLMVADRKSETLLGKDAGSEVTVYSGPGALALYHKGTVGPTGGGGRSPIEEDRHLGWVADTYDHSSWVQTTVQGDVDDLMDVLAFIINADPDEVEDQVRQALPFVELIPVLGPPGTTMAEDATVGDWYMYDDASTNEGLSVAESGDYVLWIGPYDDEVDFYFDGQQMTSDAGINAFGIQTVAVTVSAGDHSVAARVRNVEGATHLSWQLTTEPKTVQFGDPGDDVTLIACASGNAVLLPYPDATPGQTVTKSIRLLVEEAQARVALLSDIDLDFTNTTYSDGRTVEPIPDIGVKVGTHLDDWLTELCGTYIDCRVAVKDGRLALQVYEKGTMGETMTVTLDDSNLASYDAESELHDTKKAWVRWDGGWTYLNTGTGDEDVIEIGAPVALEEVERMATAALDEVNDPKTQITAVLAPVGASDAPGTGFRVGDTVTAPTGAERVVGVSLSESPSDAKVLVTLTLRDVVHSSEERTLRALGKL